MQLQPLKVGQIVPPDCRQYPDVKDQRVSRIDFNRNDCYWAIYINKDAVVLGAIGGDSIGSVCADEWQRADAVQVMTDIDDWERVRLSWCDAPMPIY